MGINILDSMIINRISAGEVVESPFSIVKELIDNSLDAGADRISVEIKNGGIDKIVVKDNGKGIDYEDIKKAFLPHATSKIKNLDDLEAIKTLGFRGEALASISNVSQTNLITRTNLSEVGYKIEVDGGEFGEIQATSSDFGTRIEVDNLFYNTPARKKFLKKPKSEENQITNIIARYILANPTINFRYVVDDKLVYQTRGKSLFDAISCVYNDEITQNIMPVEKSYNNMCLTGYVSKVGFSKPNTTYQTLIVNGRYVIDEVVSKAVYMAFEEYLMTRQFPFFVLNLTIPNVDVDVNVHPSKMNVKFSSPSKVYELVYTAVRAQIFNSLNPKIGGDYIKVEGVGGSSDSGQNSLNIKDKLIKTDIDTLKEIDIEPNTNASLSNTQMNLRQESFTPITMFNLNEELAKQRAEQSNQLGKANDVESTKFVKPAVEADLTIGQQDKVCKNNNIHNISSQLKDEAESLSPSLEDRTNNTNIGHFVQENSDASGLRDIDDFPDYKIIGELFNEFLILEKNDNMILIDFHAGHERLNYDRLVKMVEDREIVVQDLLVPYVQELSVQEVDFIMGLKESLNDIGFDIDSFGDKKIIINSIPLQLKDINLKNFVDDLVHDMKNLKPSFNNEIKHYLMQKACKSSVKSGMKLSEMEIKELLRKLDDKNPVLLCPHGRPVVAVMSKTQIEKMFKRIV